MLPTTPNPVEELLKRYAQKRREQAGGPFDLHLADRRLLQAEVQRQYAHPRPLPKTGLWAFFLAWWPQLRMTVGILIVMGLVAWVFFHDQNPAPTRQLAKNEPSSKTSTQPVEFKALDVLAAPAPSTPAESLAKTKPVVQPASPPAPVAAPTATPPPLLVAKAESLDRARGLAAKDTRDEKPAENVLALKAVAPKIAMARVKTEAEKQTAPPVATADFARAYNLAAQTSLRSVGAQQSLPPGQGLADYYASAAKESAAAGGGGVGGAVPSPVTANKGFAFGAANQPPPAPVNAYAFRAETASQPTPGLQQRYAIFAADTPPQPTGAPESQVLATFTLQQTGEHFRILDADGSVYDGRPSRVDAAPAPAAMARSRSADTTAPSVRSAPARRLQTTASDSLALGIQFFGTNTRLGQTVTLNATLAQATNLPSVVTNPAAVGQIQPVAQTPPAQIQGTLRVGNGPERKLRAVPISP
jgi:hypothetical protein